MKEIIMLVIIIILCKIGVIEKENQKLLERMVAQGEDTVDCITTECGEDRR